MNHCDRCDRPLAGRDPARRIAFDTEAKSYASQVEPALLCAVCGVEFDEFLAGDR